MLFEEFYDIQYGEPANGLASFSYIRIDAFARIHEREYGTIVPRDPQSVTVYDVDALTELLTEHLCDALGVYKIVGVRIAMKAGEQFHESALLDYYSGKLAMLCVRGGLAINNDGDISTVYDDGPREKLSQWDCELLSDLGAGRFGDNPRHYLKLFKERYPSLMIGYEGPVVDPIEARKPVLCFMEQANQQVREVLEYFGREPYSEIHYPGRSTYDFYNDAKIVVTKKRVTVQNSKGESMFRADIDKTKAMVIDLMRPMHSPKGSRVGERMFRALATALDSSVHDIEIESDVLVAFKLDSFISVRYYDHSIIADFEIGDRRVCATLIYAVDYDAFLAYLEKMITAPKATKWQPE